MRMRRYGRNDVPVYRMFLSTRHLEPNTVRACNLGRTGWDDRLGREWNVRRRAGRFQARLEGFARGEQYGGVHRGGGRRTRERGPGSLEVLVLEPLLVSQGLLCGDRRRRVGVCDSLWSVNKSGGLMNLKRYRR